MVSVGKEYRQILFSAHVKKKWIHKRCSGVRGDLSRVADGFRCRRCDGTIQKVDLAEDIISFYIWTSVMTLFCFIFEHYLVLYLDISYDIILFYIWTTIMTFSCFVG